MNAHDEWTSPESRTVRPPAAARRTIHVDDAAPLGRVAVPLVVVHDPAVEHRVAVREQPVHPLQRARPGQLQLVHHHAAGHHRPRPRRRPAARGAMPAARRRGATGPGRRGRALPRRPPGGRGPTNRVSSSTTSARSPTANERHVTNGSSGSRSRPGSHSWRAAAAAPPARPTGRAGRGRGAWPRRARRCR